MASYEFKNNARSTVADNPLAQAATTLNVATGEGANFPSSFPFKISLWDATTYPNPGDDSGMEIVKCTGRSTDALTIVRAQEGTADVAHSLGERVAMLITAGHFNDVTTGIITKLDTIETNAKDDQNASEVPNTPAGNIAATDVQAAINELDTEKAPLASPAFTGLVRRYASNGITAYAGGGQANAAQLSANINEITVCATSGDSVKLPDGVNGREIVVINNGATALDVFPTSGDYINNVLDTAVSIPVGYTGTFNCYTSDRWESYIPSDTEITAESFNSSPAHLTTDQDAGKAFTISSFPTHAQIKKIHIRADFTAGQQSNIGSALINDGTGIAPADTSIVYDGDSPTDLFAVDDQIKIDSEWIDVTAVNTSTNTLTVTRGIKGTMAAYHDDNAIITKGNHGIRVVLFKDSSKKYSERIIELSSMMTYKGVTDAAISANDDYFGLTADIQNLGNGDFLVIEDTAEEICKVQNVNHDVASATYDYTIFVQDDLAAHDITKDVKKLIVFDLDVPYSSGAGTLYGTVFIDEKIAATVNVKVEIETDSYT